MESQQQERRSNVDSRERIAVLETQMRAMETQMAEMGKDVKKVLATLSEARGGWKIMMILGGGTGALGAFIATWLHGWMPK